MKSVLKTITPSNNSDVAVAESPIDFKKLLDFKRSITVRNGETHIQPEGERAMSRSLYVEALEFRVNGIATTLRLDKTPYFNFVLPLTSEVRTTVLQSPECARMLIGEDAAYPIRFTLSGAYAEDSGHLNIVGTLLPHNNFAKIELTHLHLVYSEV